MAAMPPTIAAPMEAGSGPIFRPSGAKSAFASAPMTPGSSAMRRPPSFTSARRKPPATCTSTASVTAWPERLVPAARKVHPSPSRLAAASTAATSSEERTWATTRGTRR